MTPSRPINQADDPAKSRTRDGAGAETVDLSVLFVTRNEEAHIEDCIRSTMHAVDVAKHDRVLRSVEYLLVDSASTDRTLEIVSGFPVRVVRLEPTWPLSCGAGCFVGILHARGIYTAIINGDMTIDPRWFADVLPRMAGDVGAVCGVAMETLTGRDPIERLLIRYSTMDLSEGSLAGEVLKHRGGFSAGTLIVRTEAVRRVGSYNPFFVAAEDMDLRYRLIGAGWKVPNLPILQGVHYWSHKKEPLGLLSYFRTMFRNSIGLGQLARYSLPSNVKLSRRATQAVLSARPLITAWKTLGFLSLLLLNIATIFTLSPVWLSLVVLADVGVGLALAFGASRARLRFSDYAFSVLWYTPVYALLRTLGFVRGFSRKPHGPDDYPRSAKVGV